MAPKSFRLCQIVLNYIRSTECGAAFYCMRIYNLTIHFDVWC